MANINRNHLEFENMTAKEAIDSGLIVKIDEKDQSPCIPGDNVDLYTFNLNLLYPKQYPEKYAVELITDNNGNDKYQNTFEKYFNYDFEVKKIGTKSFDFFYIEKDDFNDNLEVFFDSARGPPVGLMETIAKKFPDLKGILYYEEPGMGFQGTITIKNGKAIDKEEPYVQSCIECGTKNGVEYRDDVEGFFCDECYEIEKEMLKQK